MQLRKQLLKSFFAAALIWALSLSPLAMAASPFSAAYRVNSSVITNYEIDQMAKMMEALGRGRDNPRQEATELLINQRLLAAEAQRYNIQVTPEMIGLSLGRISQDRSPDQMRAALNQQGIENETIDTYISSQILLRSYLDLRGIDIDIKPEEVTTRIMQIPDQVTPVVNIAEIVMPYAEYGGRLPTRLAMTQARDELRAGKSFSQLAREISRSPTASNGGRLPPIPRENLTGELIRLVNNTRPGQIAPPIETEGGIILLQYVGPSEIRNSLPRNPVVTYAELFYPANGNLAQSKANALALERQITSCEQAQNLNPQAFRDDVPISSLSPGMNLTLARLETGTSTVFEREDGTSLVFLCNRGVAVPSDLQEGVNAFAQGEALDAHAKGVIQELRNVANIVKVQ